MAAEDELAGMQAVVVVLVGKAVAEGSLGLEVEMEMVAEVEHSGDTFAGMDLDNLEGIQEDTAEPNPEDSRTSVGHILHHTDLEFPIGPHKGPSAHKYLAADCTNRIHRTALNK